MVMNGVNQILCSCLSKVQLSIFKEWIVPFRKYKNLKTLLFGLSDNCQQMWLKMTMGRFLRARRKDEKTLSFDFIHSGWLDLFVQFRSPLCVVRFKWEKNRIETISLSIKLSTHRCARAHTYEHAQGNGRKKIASFYGRKYWRSTLPVIFPYVSLPNMPADIWKYCFIYN